MGLSAFHALTIFFRGASAMLSLRTAAKNLHVGMLNNVLRLPMSFFDTTPLGRIVARFSKDQDTLDKKLPESFNSLVACLLDVTCTPAATACT